MLHVQPPSLLRHHLHQLQLVPVTMLLRMPLLMLMSLLFACAVQPVPLP
jgi:hypothetical protein